MKQKKSLHDNRREKEEEYYQKFVEPIDELLRIIEEKKKLGEENPGEVLKDPFFQAFVRFGEKIQKSKINLEQNARNLLFAHAGGAVLTINMLPSIINDKILLQIASDALNNFTFGLLSLLISYFLITFSEWVNLVQNFIQLLNIESPFIEKLANINLDSPTVLFAGIFGLISFILFVATIYEVGNSIRNIV